MNRFLLRGITLSVMVCSVPLLASALKPYKPEIAVKFVVTSELKGEMHLDVTAPTAESVQTGSGWWSQESAGDPLPDGTTMTISVTRSCSKAGESGISVLNQDGVAPGQVINLIDNSTDHPLQSGYSYTYYCTASITQDDTTETSTEVYGSSKFGMTFDMSSGAEVTENADGTVTIKYTLPSTYGGTEAIPVPLTSVSIYRLGQYDSSPASDAEPFQTIVSPEKGTTVEFTDDAPTMNKKNNWYILAKCELGDGGTKVSGWVGYDVPYGASAVQAVQNGKGMTLTWTAPTSGQNSYDGSKFDPAQTRYRIYRTQGYSKDTWTMIAEDIAETEYTDDASDLEAPVKINYAVEAYNSIGAGSSAYPNNTQSSSQPFVVGPFYTLPFEENVTVDKKTDNVWLPENPNGGDTWSFMNPFKVGNSYNPTATVGGPDDKGVMGINYSDYDYNRPDTKNTLSSYGIDLSNAGKPVLRFSYYAIPGNDTQFDVVAIKDGVQEVLRNIKISDGIEVDGFAWNSDNWKPVEIDLTDYAGTPDFRIGFASWYESAKHTTMISAVSIKDENPDNPVGIDQVQANDSGISVYSIDGVQVLVNADRNAVANLKPGTYIVRANGKARVIMVR